MSKFLKFIVHFVILLTIADVLAMAVPPFLGIRTEIIDGRGGETNLPVGSVTYAKAVNVSELKEGDSILVTQDGSTYRYKINSIDASAGIFNVYDATDVDAGETQVTLRNEADKVFITVGYMGYLIIATQSMEGMIIIGLVILFLIILFILAELWRKDKHQPSRGEQPSGEYLSEGEYPPEENGYDRELRQEEVPLTKRQRKKQLKKMAKEEARLDKVRAKEEYKEASRQLKEEAKIRKKEAKRRRKEAKRRARTGGFIEDYDPIETKNEPPKSSGSQQNRVSAATAEANKVLKREVAAAAIEPVQPVQDAVSPFEEEPKKENTDSVWADMLREEAGELLAAATRESEEEFISEEEISYRKMAVPTYTEQELLSRAEAAGEAPEVFRDEKVGITLLDYTDIIIDDLDEDE